MEDLARSAALLALASTVSLACGPGTTTNTVENDGRVCLFNTSNSPADGVQSGDVSARVYFDTCLSSSCDTVQSSNCTASLSGSTIDVESEVIIEEQGGACTDDCRFVNVDCEVGTLDSGDFTLDHGEESMDFSVPSDDSVCGAGTAPAPEPGA